MKKILKFSGPVLFVITWQWMLYSGHPNGMSITAGLLAWMALWWMTEAVNIYITALLPLFILPLSGVVKMSEITPSYMNDIIVLFIASFLFAYALEKWNLHNRVALKIILSVGNTPARVLFGVMFSAYFISMWINNTATVAMLLPAVLAIIGQLDKPDQPTKMAAPLLIGLAFSASIGGMATLVGTFPNMIFFKEYHDRFPDETPVTFADWMMFGIPISIAVFFVCYFVLKTLHRQAMTSESLDLTRCKNDYAGLGKIKYEEKWMIFFFFAMLFLWFFLYKLDLGSFSIPAWPSLFGVENGISKDTKFITEATVAMALVFLMFFIPTNDKKNKTLLDWHDVKRIPLGILFLFGGGFAISDAVDKTELDLLISGMLMNFSDLSPFVLIIALCIFMTILSEFASNTASLQLVFPILAPFVLSLGIQPLMVLIPVTLAASSGFMLPIATPPNTLVFASERIKTKEMIRSGFFIDLAGITIITLSAFTIIKWVMNL